MKKPLKKTMFEILISAILFYLILLVFLYFYQSKLMYFPETVAPDIHEFGLETVDIAEIKTVDGLSIQGWYFPPKAANKQTIILFHGNAGHYAHRFFKVAPYLEEGYGVLLAGYRGYGGNPGKPSELAFYEDAQAYMNWLIDEKDTAADDIVVYGESIGTGVAVEMATRFEIGALILESPFTSTVDIAKRTYFFMPVGLLMRDQFKSHDKIKNVKCPVLFLHGQKDTLIPIAFGRRLFEAATGEKYFVEFEEAGHNDIYDYEAPLHVLEFLRNIAGQKE